MFPSRRPGLSLSPGPAGDVSHTCAEDAPVTGEEAAAGGGAGGGEGAPTSSCSPAPWPGTVPAPSHPPPARPPSLSSLYPPAGARPRPAPPVCSALPAPLQQPPPPPPPEPGWFRKCPYSSRLVTRTARGPPRGHRIVLGAGAEGVGG